MDNEQRLELYLQKLDKALKKISVSEKAEIITEIRSHILDALERGDQTLKEILHALGEPEQVANRYLLERGLGTESPAVFPAVVKWLTIGFLGTVAMVMVFAVVLLFVFTPVVKVENDDSGNGRVKVLGGMIDLSTDELSEGLFSGLEGLDVDIDWDDENRKIHKSQGKTDPLKEGQVFAIAFSNGKVSVEGNAQARVLQWSCKSKDRKAEEKYQQVSTQVKSLDFSRFSGISCDLAVPSDITLQITGANGVIEFEEPLFDVQAALSNGKIEFEPDASKQYVFENRLNIGKISGFPDSVPNPDYRISLRLDNGVIRYDD